MAVSLLKSEDVRVFAVAYPDDVSGAPVDQLHTPTLPVPPEVVISNVSLAPRTPPTVLTAIAVPRGEPAISVQPPTVVKVTLVGDPAVEIVNVAEISPAL